MLVPSIIQYKDDPTYFNKLKRIREKTVAECLVYSTDTSKECLQKTSQSLREDLHALLVSTLC